MARWYRACCIMHWILHRLASRPEERLLTRGRQMATKLPSSRKSPLSQRGRLEILSALTETPAPASRPCIPPGLSSDPRIGICTDFLGNAGGGPNDKVALCSCNRPNLLFGHSDKLYGSLFVQWLFNHFYFRICFSGESGGA